MYAESLEEMEEMRDQHRNLKPPKNGRNITPHCCATCHFHMAADSVYLCARPDSPAFDAGDMMQWFYVCDYWREDLGSER